MASSFDSEQVTPANRVFLEVMALFAAIKDTPGVLKVRRAEMRQGEVRSEPIDFCIDVELKAKRAIMAQFDPYNPTRIFNEWFKVLDNPENYLTLPMDIREVIGREFELCGLGVDGAYKLLYWRVKNNYQKQEETSGIFE